MVALNAATAMATADSPAMHQISWMYATIVERPGEIWPPSRLDLFSIGGLLSLDHLESQCPERPKSPGSSPCGYQVSLSEVMADAGTYA
jgi:hypothetical protein